MNKFPFYTALSQCFELYAVELNEDLFETYGMTAWRKIGNKDYKVRSVLAHPLPDPDGGWFVCKPCDLGKIEAITLTYEDALETSAILNRPGRITHSIEEAIESEKYMLHELYSSGKYVKYKELADKIFFTEPYPVVYILYKKIYTDEKGLPFLNSKEAFAIATYCAYIHYFKEGLKQKDQSSLGIALLLKKDWLSACSAARVAETLSQNDVNEILDSQASWDRHNFGRTSKPIK